MISNVLLKTRTADKMKTASNMKTQGSAGRKKSRYSGYILKRRRSLKERATVGFGYFFDYRDADVSRES